MQRRELLGFLLSLSCVAATGSAAAQTAATVLTNETVPEAPLTDFSSKKGGRGGGRGRGRGGEWGGSSDGAGAAARRDMRRKVGAKSATKRLKIP